MNYENEGGSAFPKLGPNGQQSKGMSLRDYFAAQIAAGDASAENGWGNGVTKEQAMGRARTYYAVADAMIAVRNESADF